MTQLARKVYPVESGKLAEVEPNKAVETVINQLPHPSKYLFNRELSLIEFFRRVLEEAQDRTQPLLERLKFLSILSSNLDEFFMIRVSSLKEKYIDKTSPDGMTPAEQLTEIKAQLTEMINAQMKCLCDDVLPALANEGILIASYNSLNDSEKQYLDEYFRQKIYPLLTPQAVDPSHPFPTFREAVSMWAYLLNPRSTAG